MIKEKIVIFLDREAEKCTEWYTDIMENIEGMCHFGMISDEGKKQFKEMAEGKIKDKSFSAEATINRSSLGDEFRQQSTKVDKIRFKIFYYNFLVFTVLKMLYFMVIVFFVQDRILRNHAYSDMCDKAMDKTYEEFKK